MSPAPKQQGIALFQVLVLVLILSTLLSFALQRSQGVVGTAAAMQARMDFVYESRTIEALALTRLFEGPGAALPLEAYGFAPEAFSTLPLHGEPILLGLGLSLSVYDLTGVPPVTLGAHPVWEAFALEAEVESAARGGELERCGTASEAYSLALPLCRRVPDLFPHAAFAVAGEFNLAHLPSALSAELFGTVQGVDASEAPSLGALQQALRNRLGARYQSDFFLASTQPVEPLLVLKRENGEHRFKARTHVILDGVDGEAFTILRRTGF